MLGFGFKKTQMLGTNTIEKIRKLYCQGTEAMTITETACAAYYSQEFHQSYSIAN